VILCLNRGNLSSPKSIPVFHASRLLRELDDIARSFISEFADVEESDGKPIRVTLPQSILGLKKEMQSDRSDGLLRFVWQFMPPERQMMPLPQGIRVKFVRHNEAPRRRTELTRAAFVDPDLRVPLPHFTSEPKRGSQFANMTEVGDGDGHHEALEKEPSSARSKVSAQLGLDEGRLIQTLRL